MMTFGKIGTKPLLFKHWTARDYVQNGLIAMWDGIENAGWGVHDANATVWVDLINGRVGTKQQGTIAWEENCIVFSNGRGLVITPRFAANSVGTVELVFNKTAEHDNYLNFVWASNENGYAGTWICDWGSGLFIKDDYSSKRFTGSQNYTTTKAVSAVFGSEKRLVLNGNNKSVLANGGNPINLGYTIMFGFHGNTDNWYGRSYCVRVYSRALSAEEIAANYAVDKVRFNLP